MGHPIDPLLSMAPTDPFLHSRRDIAYGMKSSHQPNQTTSSSQNEIVGALGGNQTSFPATLYTSNQTTLYNHIIHIQQNPQIQILLLQKYHFPFDLLSTLLNLASIHSLLLSPAGVRCLRVDRGLTEEILTICESLIHWYHYGYGTDVDRDEENQEAVNGDEDNNGIFEETTW